MNTVFVHSQKVPFDPKRITDIRHWHAGMMVRNLVPAFFAKLDPGSYIININGGKVKSDACLVKPGDHVTFTVRPSGVDPVTIAFLGKGIFYNVPAWLGATAAAIGNLAIAFFVGKVIGPPPKAQDRDESLKSKTHQFGGIRSSRDEGTPIPVLYGQFRTGGVVIFEDIDYTIFNAETTYNAIFLLSHGPINSVGGKFATATGSLLTTGSLPGGMEVNGNPVSNYEGVEVQVRLGTIEQDPASGFGAIPTINDGLSFLLEQNVDPADNPNTNNILTVSTFSNKTLSDAQFIFGEQYDLASEADFATLQISFEKGLFRVDSSGNILPHTCRFIAKYIELDGGGVPITTGGPNADGFVRLPPFAPISTKKTDSFTASIPISFVDPQTYVFPTIGEVLLRSTTGTAIAPIAHTLTPNVPFAELTFDFWIGTNVALGETYAPGNVDEELMRWLPSLRGMGIKLRKVGSATGPYVAISVITGDGTVVQDVPFQTKYDEYFATSAANLTPIAAQWRHVVITYKKAFDGGTQNRYRLYLDGVLRETITSTVSPSVPGTGSNFTIAVAPAANASRRYDELRLVARELTADEVAANYNIGEGAHGVASADLLAGYHFNSGAGTTPDYSTSGNTMTLTAGPTISTGSSGKVFSGSGTKNRKRSRYRIVLLRNSLDGTNDKVSDDVKWTGVTTYLEANLAYPESALVAVTMPASEQLSGNVPECTFRAKGRPVPMWDGSNISEDWSNNPAWIALDVILNTSYGAGRFFEVGDIYLDELLEWANYCDELVDNKRDRLAVNSAGVEITDFTYWNNVAFGPDTFDEVLQIMGTGQTGGITTDAWRKLGKPQVGDFLLFTGCPDPDPGGIYLTGINGVDGPIGFTVDQDVSISGGLEIVYIRTFGNSVEIYLQWPGVGIPERPWTATNLMSTFIAVNSGTCRKQERRYRCDGVIDVSRGFWDTLISICATGRGVPMPVGDKIRVRFDAPSSPVDIIGLGNIIKGSFELDYTGPELKPNVLLAEFWDASKNWERSYAWVEHPNVQATDSFEGYRVINQTVWGQTSRARVMRFGLWQLNMMQLLTRSGKFSLGPDSIPYEAGDVVTVHHALINNGMSGRVAKDSVSALGIFLDTDIYVPSAGTYEIIVRDNTTGENKTVTIDFSAVGAYPHTFATNTSIPITAPGFNTFLPQAEDVFIFTLQGADFNAKIVSIRKKPDQSADVEYIEYKDEVYNDDTFDPILGLEWQGDDPSITERTIPGIVESPSARVLGVTGSGGSSHGILHVDWEHDAGTLFSLHRTEIYVRVWKVDRESRDRGWKQVAVSNGRESHAEVEVQYNHGDTLEVAIRPVNSMGEGRHIDRCACPTVQVVVSEVPPVALSAFSIEMSRDKAIYSLTQPANARAASLAPVIRRGGWILGLPGFTLPPDTQKWGPTPEWCGSPTSVAGKVGDTLYARNRTGAGNYSLATVLESNLNFTGFLTLSQFVRESQSWEDYGSGFLGGGDVPAPSLTGGVVSTDWEGRKFIEFTGSNLTLVYTTSVGLAIYGKIGRDCFCEVVMVGEQVHPFTIDLLSTYPVSSHEMGQWTGEGPIADLFTKCEVKVEIEEDGVWKLYKPGIYRSKNYKYRFTVTRPSDDFNIRIYRIATRARRVIYEHYNRNMVGDLSRRELTHG